MIDHQDADDAALVAQALAGDYEAFGALLLRYAPSVARLCRRLLGATLEAQDAAQEAALQAFLGLSQLDDPARFGAWLHAIAANLARMELRRRRALSLDALGGKTPYAALGIEQVPAPEEAYVARETHDAIVNALAELSQVNRAAVIGYYLEGYSYAELAELLGVPVSTVKGRLFKGRRQLRRSLAPLARDLLPPGGRALKEQKMENVDAVEMTIDTLRSTPDGLDHRLVVLRQVDDRRVLPIFIGNFEAAAIQMAVEGQQTPRPMTHDLALRLLETLGARVRRVTINRLHESIFYADIMLAQGEQIYHVDARPSDALALAGRVDAPVYAVRAVLDEAGGPDEPAFWEKTWAEARAFHERQGKSEP
jgi:RNA polymerase sigma factor (sigma-70 family)